MQIIEEKKTYTIDAADKKLGRVATQAATYLMGKNMTSFVRNKAPLVEVHITNASKMAISNKKEATKEYKHFSGYPSGLKIESLAKVVAKKGYAEILKHAVRGMLPSNKLRPGMLKKLIISE